MSGPAEKVSSIYELGLIVMSRYRNIDKKTAIMCAIDNSLQLTGIERQILLLGKEAYEEVEKSREIIKYGGLTYFYDSIEYLEPQCSKLSSEKREIFIKDAIAQGVFTETQLIAAKITKDYKFDVKFDEYINNKWNALIKKIIN